MRLSNALLPDGRTVHCVNAYEVDFSAHEIFNEDLSVYGLDMPADGLYLDVGANIGLFSLYIVGKCPQATVFAFEPMPAAFAALERNIIEFGPSVVPFLMGLGASPGLVEVIVGDLGRRGFKTRVGDHPMAQAGASVFHIYATRAGVSEFAS